MDSLYNLIAGFIALAIFIAMGFLIVYILFLNSLSSALKCVSPINRKISPGLVYLMFIPIFNLIWVFILVNNIADSLQAEYKSRNIPCNNRPTFDVGIGYAITTVISVFMFWLPVVNLILSVVVLVLWISYWIDVSKHTKILESQAGNVINFPNSSNSYSSGYNSSNNMGYNSQNANSSNYGGTGGQNGYQGGYSGGHNNPNFNSHNNSNQGYSNNSGNDDGYKSGDLYK